MEYENKKVSFHSMVLKTSKRIVFPVVLSIFCGAVGKFPEQYSETIVSLAKSISPFVIIPSIVFIIMEIYRNYRCPNCNKVPTGFQGILLFPEECPHCGYK